MTVYLNKKGYDALEKCYEAAYPKKERIIRFEPDPKARTREFDSFAIDNIGLIVKTEPYNVPYYKGCLVDLKTLQVGKRIEYLHPMLGRCGIKWKVTAIEEVK